MVRFGVPGQNIDPTSYADSRLSTVPAVQAPRRPTVNDKKFPMWCEWRTNKDVVAPVTEGEFWKLIRFESNGDATWERVDIGGGLPGVDDLRDQVNVQVTPDVNGNIDIDGAVVANAANPSSIPLETVADAGTNTLDVQIQVGAAITGAPADKNDAGLVSADDTTFAINADGYMTLIGGTGPALQKADVDFNTGPGVDPVLPSATGQISIFGNVVTNGTNANSPVATHSRALNQFHVDVQQTTALTGAPADPFDAGIASFDDIYFSASANAFVSLNDLMFNGKIGDTLNLGIFKSGDVITVKSAVNTDLSASNPGFVVLPSNATLGNKVVKQITANASFEDSGGTNDTNGFTWGLGATDSWGTNDLPFFVMAVLKDDDSDVAFAITRDPGRSSSAASGQTGHLGGGTITHQAGFFYLKDLTAGGGLVTEWASQTTAPIGALRLRTTNGGSAWVVQTPDGSSSGIGRFMEHFAFTFPAGVMGASADSFFLPNGGTAPTFSSVSSYLYQIDKDGQVNLFVFMEGDDGADGSGAVSAQVSMPYINHLAWDMGAMRIINPALSTLAVAVAVSNQNYFLMYEEGLTLSQNGDYTNGARQVTGQLRLFLQSV